MMRSESGQRSLLLLLSWQIGLPNTGCTGCFAYGSAPVSLTIGRTPGGQGPELRPKYPDAHAGP